MPRAESAERVPFGCFWVGVALFLFGVPISITMIRSAIEEYRVRNTYVETRCTVLDARLETSKMTESSNSDVRRGRTIWYHPTFLLRYEARGRTITSRGFSSKNYQETLDGAMASAALETYAKGTVARCWFDPAAPERVVLVRDAGDRRRYLMLIPSGAALIIAFLVFITLLHEYGWRGMITGVGRSGTRLMSHAPPRVRRLLLFAVIAVVVVIAISIVARFV